MSICRFGERDACSGACGRARLPGGPYCAECRDAKKIEPPYVERDLDLHIEVMEERVRGERRWRDRIEKEGTHPCGLCGRPALPGRLYCSPRCRGCAPRVGGAIFVLDGIEASMVQHARRLGLKKDTVIKRVSRGMDPLEALTTPIDERPLWERRSYGFGKSG